MVDKLDIERTCDVIGENFSRLKAHAGEIAAASQVIIESLRGGGKAMFCGNGGSAGDSQHLAAELMGRYKRDRDPLAAIALTVDSSAITAIANDYGYAEVFARQIRGVARKGDVLIALSTSGNSPNIIAALQTARDMGVTTVGLTGEGGGKMAALCDLCIRVPSDETSHIQEMHIAIGHIICGAVESEMC